MKITLNDMYTLECALNDATGCLTDNSCHDPDCCGGPIYSRREFEEAVEVLKKFGLDLDESA